MKRRNNNLIIRRALLDRGFNLRQLADILNISTSTLSRRLRDELPEEKQREIARLIDGYAGPGRKRPRRVRENLRLVMEPRASGTRIALECLTEHELAVIFNALNSAANDGRAKERDRKTALDIAHKIYLGVQEYA